MYISLPAWLFIITFLELSKKLVKLSLSFVSKFNISPRKLIYPMASLKVSTFESRFSYGSVGICDLSPSNASFMDCIRLRSRRFAACRKWNFRCPLYFLCLCFTFAVWFKTTFLSLFIRIGVVTKSSSVMETEESERQSKNSSSKSIKQTFSIIFYV